MTSKELVQQMPKAVVFVLVRHGYMSSANSPLTGLQLRYVCYTDGWENYLSRIRELISRDLSEPYSIYVYRYFLGQWGDLCYLVCQVDSQRCE